MIKRRLAAMGVLALAGLLAMTFYPKNSRLEDFQRLSFLHTFMLKHRLTRPPSYAKTTWQDIMAGKHDVGTGVELVGAVAGVFSSTDLDYCFTIGDVQIEITPEWRLFHPEIAAPRFGQRVRVRGWTFYDRTHDDEPVYDPAHPGLRKKRATFWEVHPADEVLVLGPGQS